MKKQLFLSLAAIVFCITIPIGCNSGSSNQPSGDEATQASQQADDLHEAEQILFHATLTGDGIRLRAAADTLSKVQCQLLSKGDTVGVIIDDAGNGWSKINYKDTIGFVPSKFLEPLPNAEAVKDNAEANGAEGADADKTEEEDGTNAEGSTDQAQPDVKDGAEDGAAQTEATDKDTTSTADVEKGDTTLTEGEQTSDTMVLSQIIGKNDAVVESSHEQDPKGVPYWLAGVIGGGALLLGILPTYFIMRKRKRGSDEKGGGHVNPNSPTPQEVKELRKRADELDKDVNKLRKEVETAKRSYDEAKRKLDSAERDKKDAVQQAVKQCREEYDIVINRMQKEMKLYTERAVFFLPAQGFAQRAAAFFDELDQLQADATRFKTDVPPGVNADDYNYYLMRIERKFYTAIAKVDALPQWRRELQMLAKTGLIPAGGLIDKRMGGGKVKEQEMEGTLRMLLYQAVMNTLAGAAVVMSDEMAIMLPQMVAGVKGADVFVKTTSRLKKAITDMGYELNYVMPFSMLSAYKDVQNVQFTKADVPEGTIFEVMKMAVNFGSTKSNTEVSAK